MSDLNRSISEYARKGRDGTTTGTAWLAKYQSPETGRYIAKRGFKTKRDAREWLDTQTTAVVSGQFINPQRAKTTMRAWSEEWLKGQRVNKASTYRQAKTHLVHINRTFGDTPIRDIKPSHVKAWLGVLQDAGLADSTRYAIYRRLHQVMSDAHQDGLIQRNPCSRKIAPPAGTTSIVVPTTAEVWQLHAAFDEHTRIAILLGAFAGLRIAEVCGLRVVDVDLMRGIIHPTQQWPDKPYLKNEASRSPITMPPGLVDELTRHIHQYAGSYVMSVGSTRIAPWTLERDIRAHRAEGSALRFHDLRHFLASYLISQGRDIKSVQHAMRHADVTTTLRTYGHLWPDAIQDNRDAVQALFSVREESVRGADIVQTPTPLRKVGADSFVEPTPNYAS